MKVSRLLWLLTSLLIVSFSTLTANASESVPGVPTLISVQVEDIRGSFVSYQEGLLRVVVNEEEVTIKVDPMGEIVDVIEATEATYGSQFEKLQANTLIDMMVSKGVDTTYILESLLALHQRYDTEPVPELISELEMNTAFLDGFDLIYKEDLIAFDVKPQVIDQKVMVPLRAIAEALGYEVIWNNTTRSVDLIQGPNFTTVYIGQNSYFKHRMAPRELSVAPVIIDGRTLVPMEFITEILGYGFTYNDKQVTLDDEPLTTLSGYISDIQVLDDYRMVFVAPRKDDDVEMWEQTVLIVTEETMINRGPLAIGEMIHGVHQNVMTMSIPGQTSAVIIY